MALALCLDERAANGHLCFAGPSRCFAFWQELLGCYVVNGGEGDEGKKKCIPALEDYYECLHHTKEVCHGSWIPAITAPAANIKIPVRATSRHIYELISDRLHC